MTVSVIVVVDGVVELLIVFVVIVVELVMASGIRLVVDRVSLAIALVSLVIKVELVVELVELTNSGSSHSWKIGGSINGRRSRKTTTRDFIGTIAV